jgi:hypothetical protein
MSGTPEGLDSSITTREMIFEADVASVTPFLKLATVRRRTEPRWPRLCPDSAHVL